MKVCMQQPGEAAAWEAAAGGASVGAAVAAAAAESGWWMKQGDVVLATFALQRIFRNAICKDFVFIYRNLCAPRTPGRCQQDALLK